MYVYVEKAGIFKLLDLESNLNNVHMNSLISNKAIEMGLLSKQFKQFKTRLNKCQIYIKSCYVQGMQGPCLTVFPSYDI